MSCNLSLGRLEPCKDKVGGLKAVYFVNYAPLSLTYDATDTDVVDDIHAADGTSDVTAFKYDLKGTNSFEQNVNASRENGTVFYEQVLNLQLKGLSKASHKELKLMAYGRPHVLVEDNNGKFFLMGASHGADVTGGTIVTGAAMGDLYGYTLTLTAQEAVPANFVDVADLSTIMTVTAGS